MITGGGNQYGFCIDYGGIKQLTPPDEVAGRGQKEYQKEYKENHKDKTTNYNKVYYQEKGKQTIQCHICNINIVLRHRKNHENTKTHQNNLTEFNIDNNLCFPINNDIQA